MDRRLRDPPVNETSPMADRGGEEAVRAARGRLRGNFGFKGVGGGAGSGLLALLAPPQNKTPNATAGGQSGRSIFNLL